MSFILLLIDIQVYEWTFKTSNELSIVTRQIFDSICLKELTFITPQYDKTEDYPKV